MNIICMFLSIFGNSSMFSKIEQLLVSINVTRSHEGVIKSEIQKMSFWYYLIGICLLFILIYILFLCDYLFLSYAR